jgi:hypothetical protein
MVADRVERVASEVGADSCIGALIRRSRLTERDRVAWSQASGPAELSAWISE